MNIFLSEKGPQKTILMRGSKPDFRSYEAVNDLVGYNEETGEYIIGGFLKTEEPTEGIEMKIGFVWGTTKNLDEVQWLFYRLSNLIYAIRNSEDLLSKTGEELVDFIGDAVNEMIEIEGALDVTPW